MRELKLALVSPHTDKTEHSVGTLWEGQVRKLVVQVNEAVYELKLDKPFIIDGQTLIAVFPPL
jgi:hypothetical protein